MSNDKVQTPESGMDSGATFPSSDTASPRVSDEENAAPESGTAGPESDNLARGSELDSDAPAAASADGEQQGEPEAAVEDRAPEAAEAVEADVAVLAAKAEKADEWLQLAQRTQADFENYRRRAIREAAAAQERGAVKLALALLPAVDNLERALAHAPNGESEEETESFVAGVKHVHDDVVNALKRAGIEPFSPQGEPFDPQYHEAVAQQPVQGTQAGTVVEVFQRGYRLGENVLRPARVVVAG